MGTSGGTGAVPAPGVLRGAAPAIRALPAGGPAMERLPGGGLAMERLPGEVLTRGAVVPRGAMGRGTTGRVPRATIDRGG